MNLRPAACRDAGAIVDLFRSAIPARYVDLSVMGCTGAARYVEDRIGLRPQDSSVFLVATDRGSVCAAAEFRRGVDAVFVNHIAVAEGAQRRGIGTALLGAGVRSSNVGSRARIGLDVFSDNGAAIAWYLQLGLSVVKRNTMHEIPLGGAPLGSWRIEGLLECRLLQREYGFGKCRVVADDGEYHLGVLDSGVVRANGAIGSAAVRSAVSHLWPDSKLISTESEEPSIAEAYASSLRMVGEVGGLPEVIDA